VTAVDPDTYSGGGFLFNTVAELRTAYDLNSLYAHGYDGRFQTVVIVDAFGSPTVYEDLLAFIQWQNSHGSNLPWTTMAEVKQHLHIYYPEGKPAFDTNDDNQLGWSTEVQLDVDMVHAIAPRANIALVVSLNDSNNVMDDAVHYAIRHHLGCAISQSWGTPEFFITQPSDLAEVKKAHSMYMEAAREGITVFAASGDWGAIDLGNYYGFYQNNALYPASDPYVTGVGGTNLFMTCDNGAYKEGTGSWDGLNHTGTSYFYEIAGNDYEGMVADGYPAPSDYVTTGGAMSTLFSLPWWQYGITLTSADGTKIAPTGRCTSDVSFDSGVYGGLGRIPWSVLGYTINYIVGGTSAGSPFWAALTAIACQYAHHNLGFINPMLYISKNCLYHAKAFRDITLGDNTWPTGYPVIGYAATRGWDAPTGIGSPDVAKLVPLMVWW
jgi:subtilase family serine protease